MATVPDPVTALAELDLFRGVGATVLESLRADLTVRSIPGGSFVVREGEEAGSVAVVIDGTVAVRVDGGGTSADVAQLGAGAVIGEVAALFGGRRSASVEAVTDAHVVDVSASGFAALLEAAPTIGTLLTERAAERLRVTQLTSHLHRLFGELPPAVVPDLLDVVAWLQLSAGSELFAQGDVGDAAYVILSGRLRVLRADSDLPIELGPGALVGELALLRDERRAATVVATRDTSLAALPRDVFEDLATRHPAAMLAVTRTILDRLLDPLALTRTIRTGATIALVPATSDVDVRVFATRLVEALASEGDVLHLWAARVDSLLHRAGISGTEAGSPDDVRLTHWLHEAEQDHRFVLVEADPEWSPWTHRAVRQADEVVVVADTRAGAGIPGPLEVRLDELSAGSVAPRRTLVLLHASGTRRPANTARWLDGRTVDRHVHVRHGDDGDLARLARTLAGTSVGLVFGGGGARGGAHLGVVRAMRELGIPIDLVGGTSIGAIVGAMVAMTWDDAELEARTGAAFRDLLDYTLPVVSLLRGQRISAAIDDAAGGRDIEDCLLPFFCISTNLTRAEEVVHRRGPLARALRASVAIPGVLPPVTDGEELLIDGGSINNLPVDRMRELIPTGTVISVDVAPPRGPRAKGELETHVSGWGALTSRVLPGRRPAPVPGMVMTLLASTIVGAMRDRNRNLRDGLADLHLALDLRGFGLLDFDRTVEAIGAGYEAALPVLGAWLEQGGTHAAADPA